MIDAQPTEATGGLNGREAFSGVEHLTDLGNARRFVRDHGSDLRWCDLWGRWLIFDGTRWQPDERREIELRAKRTVAGIYREASEAPDPDTRKKIADHARRTEGQGRIDAMIALARSEPGIPVLPRELDADPMLLACPNGTLNLQRGKLQEAQPADLLTRGTDVPYHPAAICPRWEAWLAEVFDGDQEQIAFVKRAVGYSLTGFTDEQVLFVLFGTGCNGKSTLIEKLKRILGDLAVTAAFDSFARSRADRGPREDLARLHGARLVVAAESGEGRQIDEATVKSLTGGDTVTARHLYRDHFEFVPAFKLWLVTNHRPRVDGDDDAIWRRLRLIPFDVSFEGREDRDLPQVLEAELPGILAWAVEGCLEWQLDGLGSATAVAKATADYRKDEDVLGAFLADCCEFQGETPTAAFREAYERFCDEFGEKPLTPSLLGKRLRRRGIERGGQGRSAYQGVQLRCQE